MGVERKSIKESSRESKFLSFQVGGKQFSHTKTALLFCELHKEHEHVDLLLFIQPALLLIGCYHLDPRSERLH